MALRYYDNTRISEARNCMRKFFLRHRLDWVREGLARPLLFGQCWHNAMDVVWLHADSDKTDREIFELAGMAFNQQWLAEGGPDPLTMSPDMQAYWSPRTPGVGAEMLHNYIKTRREQIRQFEVIGIEVPFAVPLDPDDPELFFIGRLDKLFKNKQGDIIIGEHKTTTSYSKKDIFRADYISSWSPNSQIDGYLYATHMLYGSSVKSVWVDAALVHKTVHNGFKFIPVNRSKAHLKSWLYDTLFWVNMIENEDFRYEQLKPDDEYLAAYPKNTGACSQWAGCTYKDICTMLPNPATQELPLGFKKEHWEPFDVLKIEELGMVKGNG
ncbi:MAG: hypothetical protein COA94_04890 [Rickettsiales bacterium]|nr:MAG: hypothetical protein COA94_04890 [Rickettsiales bacterium]